ncbi:MAG TPA: PhnD/SsuA/transferrin family substrate-binding protein [Kofleriaceae bacterium]|nr:PhnD/SsuA/transferrin family substrate-binding protein [Kofleriaceae bacterium]
MKGTLLLGAVAYDPKVVTIWDGFQRFFARHDLDVDVVLYTNYERQVEAHVAGQVHVAWNSPLAWIESERVAAARGRRARAVAMRDSDRDLTSVVVVRADSPVHTLADLRGRRIATGAADSPQAYLIPLLALAEAGVEPGRDAEVQRFDLLVGKHGDHIGGEREAARALMAGAADAACMIDSNHLLFGREGIFTPGATRVVHQTAPYDHCNFTVFEDAPEPLIGRFVELLLAMKYEDPEVRPLLDMEGLKQWMVGRTSGYTQLDRAVDRFGALDPWLGRMGARAGAGG